MSMSDDLVSCYNFYYSEILTTSEFVLYVTFGVLNTCNDILGYVATHKKNITGLSIFLVFALCLTIMSTIASFSPLVLFHLLILLVAVQIRVILVRVSSNC